MFTKLTQLVDKAKAKKTRRIAVAGGGDYEVLEALKVAQENGIIIPIIVGIQEKIERYAREIGYDISNTEIIDLYDRYDVCRMAVKLIRDGQAELLMKGMVSTSEILKAVLNKENGLRKSEVLSHVAFFESPYYHKILGLTDAAMNIDPTFEEKIAIINNAVEAFHLLGVECPRVAVVGSVETINPKMQATMEAATLSMMNKRNQITGCIIDGPLALDNAVSKKSAALKNINSEVAGDVDLVVAPEINGANFLYKALNFLGGAQAAGTIMGATVPIVLTSRADSDTSKFFSISLAAAMA